MRRGKRRNQGNNQPRQPAVKKANKEEVWRDHKEVSENTYFRKYYQIQFEPYFKDSPSEFDRFWDHMKLRLPVVFRINCNQPNWMAFEEKLLSEELVKRQIGKIEGQFEPTEDIKVQKIEWYPDSQVFSINTTKQQLKKSKTLEKLHSLIQKASDAGLISRQELVSMMPPLFLDIQSTDTVLDMCAAPGSKTSQMLQMLYNDQKTLAKGCVIANDVEYSRAQMLIHQVQRSGTAGMAVINHNAQFLPQLYDEHKHKMLFDKILVDVPCSGDGATRKLPNKWSDWHSNDGAVLHPLQLNILMRGINMLKANGLLVYSTCSLNPLEDEAVILELMRKVKSGLEIVDIHNRGIQGRRGLNHWRILQSKGKEISSSEMKNPNDELFNQFHEYVEKWIPAKIKMSMFPQSLEKMEKYGIANSMRILPHDHNSGGFFLALFRKSEDFGWMHEQSIPKPVNNNVSTQEQEENALKQHMEIVEDNLPKQPEYADQQQKPLVNIEQQVTEQKQTTKPAANNLRQKRGVPKKVEEFIQLQLPEFKIIQQFYGIEDDNFINNLFVKKDQDARKKVTLVSDGVSNYIKADKQQKLKLINMGCKAFERGKQSFAGNECLYRLCQDSIHFLLPILTKRKIRVSLDLFKLLIKDINIKHDQITEEATRKQIEEINQGSFVVYIEESIKGRLVVDALVSQNFKTAMTILVSKIDLESLRIRYC